MGRNESKCRMIARQGILIVKTFAKMLTKYFCVLIVRDGPCTISFPHSDGAAGRVVVLKALFKGPHCLP
eukprot:12415401-Ditylum_brightwellii.AAC.1